MKHHKNTIRFGVICGIVFACYTVLGRIAWKIPGSYTSIMSQASTFYINSSSDFSGAVWGTVWAFFDGLIVGVLLVWLHAQFPKNK